MYVRMYGTIHTYTIHTSILKSVGDDTKSTFVVIEKRDEEMEGES